MEMANGIPVCSGIGKINSLEAWFLDTTDNRTVNLAAFRIPSTVQSHYLQNEVHGQFATGSLKHRMLVGIELGREVHSERTLTDNICADAGYLHQEHDRPLEYQPAKFPR